MKIAILSAADVGSWYAATLMERGHQITIGPFGYIPEGGEGPDRGRDRRGAAAQRRRGLPGDRRPLHAGDSTSSVAEPYRDSALSPLSIPASGRCGMCVARA